MNLPKAPPPGAFRVRARDRTADSARTRHLGVAAALALALGPGPCAALGLGELGARSVLGEPLRAEIPLIDAAGERIEASCFELAPNPVAGDDIPWLTRARFAVDSRSRPARLLVTTSEPVSHPILMVGIKAGCSFGLTREYALLLAPAPAVATAVAAPESAAPSAAAPPARGPDRRTHVIATSAWQIVEGETLQNIAEALYPRNRSMQRRFIRATVNVNSELFRDEARPASARLPAGTTLAVPDLRRIAVTPPPETASEGETPPAPRKQAPPRTAVQPKSQDRLSIARDQTSDTAPALAPKLDPTRGGGSTDAQRDSLRQEEQLLATVEDQVVMQLALAERIRQLEETLAGLHTQLREIDQKIQVASGAPRPEAAGLPAAAVAPVPVATPAPRAAEVRDRFALRDWLPFVLLATAVLGVVLLLRARSRRPHPQPDPATAAPQRPRAMAVDIPLAVDAPLPPPRPQRRSDFQAPGRPDEHAIDVSEHESALELAEIMLSFGRVQGAAQTLADYIESNPKQAVRPWLKLLDVYRNAGMKAEFDTLARRLNQTFNVEVTPWESDASRRFAESLEGYPHIVASLIRAWNSPDALPYLNRLIRDNRDGRRAGFPLPALHEIMLLAAMKEQQESGRLKDSHAV